MEMCKRDSVYFFNNFLMTADPRNRGRSKPVYIPFNLWPRQVEYIRWREELEGKREGGVVDKPRDSGVSWLNAGHQLHHWLFHEEGFSGGFGSRKAEYVDRKGDPKSLFEKLRTLLYRLPPWMRPRGWHDDCDNFMRLLNPQNGNTITGEAGDNIGRGDRKSVYDIDEAAFLQHPELVDRSVMDCSDVVIYTSTPNGPANPFAQKRHSNEWAVFSFRFYHNPNKTQEWYDKEKRKRDPVNFAQEVDVDYNASVEDSAIPSAWVQAAIGFAEAYQFDYDGPLAAGFDVANGGNNRSVLALRRGPIVPANGLVEWQELDCVQAFWHAAEVVELAQIPLFSFDSDGVGEFVGPTIAHSDRRLNFQHQVIHGGSNPTDLQWEGERITSKEKFLNLRAELWGLVRERFRKTYNVANGLDSHPFDECISIPDHPELVAQLSQPKGFKTNSGKWKVESKRDMRKRGVSSPDYADALVYAFAPEIIKEARIVIG